MIRKGSGAARLMAIAAIIALSSGCGYRFAAGRPARDLHAPVIAGSVVENRTLYPELDQILSEAIAHRFIVERQPIHKPTGETEPRLRCTIRWLDIRPISYRRNLTAREYRITMILDAALETQGAAASSWKAEGLTLSRTYRVQNTIEATEREKKAALEALSFDAAMMIAHGILHGF